MLAARALPRSGASRCRLSARPERNAHAEMQAVLAVPHLAVRAQRVPVVL